MEQETVLYGHSRGYRTLAIFAMAACLLSTTVLINRPGTNPVALTGVVGFAVLFLYAWRRGSHRLDVMHIAEEGFVLTDPALSLGLIRYEEIEEIRIYALQHYPKIGIRIVDPNAVRRRGPAIMRLVTKPLWNLRTYQVIVELDDLNDQVAAVKSVAVRMGIPLRSELL